MRVASGELLAGALQWRKPPRPRRRVSPPNSRSMHTLGDADLVLPPIPVLHVHDGRGGHEVREVEPGGRAHPHWHWRACAGRGLGRLATQRVIPSRSAVQGSSGGSMAGRAGA